jgi:uncharacterized protein (TIGR03437 family)
MACPGISGFSFLTRFLTTLAAAAASLHSQCTSQTTPPGPQSVFTVTSVSFNLPPSQTNNYTPVGLQIEQSPDSSAPFYQAKYPTGDKYDPYRYVTILPKEAQQIYNKDCPNGPYMSFPGAKIHIAPQSAKTAAAPAYGRAATVMALADFNGDGNTDVAVANGTLLTVVLEDATASVISSNRYVFGVNLVTVIAADVNGDGYPDLVAADAGGAANPNGGLWVLLNNKNGTFAAPKEYAAGSQPIFPFAADLNGDGKLDLVVTDSGTSAYTVLLGNGDGTFQLPVTTAAGTALGVVVASDFNGDGKPDLAVMDDVGYRLLIFFGKGDGTFQQPNAFPSGPQDGGDLIFGDFNNDGHTDLIASFILGNQAIVFLNDGKGNFTASPQYLLGGSPSVLDFSPPDATGFLLFTTDFVTQTPVVVSGNPDGTLNAPTLLPTGGSDATAIAAADLNGDGREDIVQIDKGLGVASVFLNAGAGKFQTPVTYSVVTSGDSQPAPSAAGLFALRTGAKPDLVVADQGSFNPPGGLIILQNSGTGTFGTARMVAAGAGPVGMAAADFNGDGNLDLAVADSGIEGTPSSAVSVLLGDGKGNFSAPATYLAGQSGSAVASADFNGDGHPDLVVGTVNSAANTASITVLLNSGTGAFTALAPITAPSGLAQIVIADFNGDGKIDLALIGSTIQILLGNGDGTFKAGQKIATEPGANAAATADMDGNGTLDLVVGHCCGIADDTYLLGNGDGTFQAEVHFPSGPFPTGLVIGDWNGDGIPDVAVADGGAQGGELLPLLNWFGPTIVSAASFQTVPIPPQSIATAGGRDLATAPLANLAATPPTNLGGTTVQIADIAGNTAAAPLFYVSPHQVNFEVPSGFQVGPAVATITSGDGTLSTAAFLIQPASPGIFVLNTADLAAADLLQVSGSQQTYVNVYAVSNGAIVANPINLGGSSVQNILVLFGTGFRGADMSTVSVTFNGVPGTVLYSGAQGGYLGLDQANIVIPQNAGLHGDVVVAFQAAGLAANPVHLTFQ